MEQKYFYSTIDNNDKQCRQKNNRLSSIIEPSCYLLKFDGRTYSIFVSLFYFFLFSLEMLKTSICPKVIAMVNVNRESFMLEKKRY